MWKEKGEKCNRDGCGKRASHSYWVHKEANLVTEITQEQSRIQESKSTVGILFITLESHIQAKRVVLVEQSRTGIYDEDGEDIREWSLSQPRLAPDVKDIEWQNMKSTVWKSDCCYIRYIFCLHPQCLLNLNYFGFFVLLLSIAFVAVGPVAFAAFSAKLLNNSFEPILDKMTPNQKKVDVSICLLVKLQLLPHFFASDSVLYKVVRDPIWSLVKI